MYTKHKKYLLVCITAVLIFTIYSCQKSASSNEPVSTDQTKPDPITNIRVENFNGGANIIYTLPNSSNLLYVLGEYNIADSKPRQTKASYYTDTLKVDGFAESKEYEVTLYTVSRAEVKSDPIKVKVNPLTPKFQLVNSLLELNPDFGGINVSGTNTYKAPLSMHVVFFNTTTNKYEETDPVNVSTQNISFSVRGFEATSTEFGIYTTDQFGNKSDTVFKTLTPLFETMLDKSKFYEYKLPSDAPVYFDWYVRNLYDGKTTEPGWHTNVDVTTPIQATWGLGVSARLSRFRLYSRLSAGFGYQNPKVFTIWGSDKTNPENISLPNAAVFGEVHGDWTSMGTFTYPNPPSGLPPNQANSQDLQFMADGVDFNVPIDAISTRFIRLVVNQTWGGVRYTNIMEMSLYGSPE
ncbi:DUF4959 domain-containing protein [Niabella ginsengisoli]|uniref:DUF4959 domain-containing protein n=1 Tax=Niabella ginsengisoli TaxID=522298 RepID=A0ABS9SL75_9BACT|nr:DUF4959 domain-containing protein [Niabella ginsengisoli]MCH5599131.1 DUF4959 domain-containing protein [Niabella ginsengisoli]